MAREQSKFIGELVRDPNNLPQSIEQFARFRAGEITWDKLVPCIGHPSSFTKDRYYDVRFQKEGLPTTTFLFEKSAIPDGCDILFVPRIYKIPSTQVASQPVEYRVIETYPIEMKTEKKGMKKLTSEW